MIRSTIFQRRSLKFEKLFPKLAEKQGISVGDYGFGGSMEAENLYRKSSSQILYGEVGRQENKVDIL